MAHKAKPVWNGQEIDALLKLAHIFHEHGDRRVQVQGLPVADLFGGLAEVVEQLQAELRCLRLPIPLRVYGCGCTDVSACKTHAKTMRYKKCSHCGEYHIPTEPERKSL